MIRLPAKGITGPFVLSGTDANGRPFQQVEFLISPLVALAFKLDLRQWRIEGKRHGRRTDLLRG